MTRNSHPRAEIVRRVLEINGVLDEVDDVQHAVRFRASHGHLRATVLVFTTGTVLVQGRVSPLERWLCEVEASIASGRAIRAFVPPEPHRDELQAIERRSPFPAFGVKHDRFRSGGRNRL